MRINNNDWNLTCLRASDSRLRRSDNVYTLGVCDNETKTIYVSENVTGNLLRKVLLHEVTHAFCFEYQINIDMETEEILCDFMARHGADVVAAVDSIFRHIRRYA